MSYPHGQYPGEQPGQPYQPTQPYQADPYQSGPQYQQHGQYPPGPPYQPPPYGPGGPSGGGGGKMAAIIVAVLIGVVAIVGVVGVLVIRSNKDDPDIVAETTTSTSSSSSAAPTTTTETTTESPTPTTSSKRDTWIAATYKEDTNQVVWVRSTISQDSATNQVLSDCGTGCPNPIWSRNGCIALAFGQNGGWGSDWGSTIAEAESKAVKTATGVYNVSGPFELWSKCAFE
ncbi:DUF4189 domain-containing protein [Nocardia sp. NPDC051832]|uniref:DUF4189 domain-containing protein n=1 Tax=Nocardia sp. NPDC051832 TaxID=3155673 RepID=UPI00341FDE51